MWGSTTSSPTCVCTRWCARPCLCSRTDRLAFCKLSRKLYVEALSHGRRSLNANVQQLEHLSCIGLYTFNTIVVSWITVKCINPLWADSFTECPCARTHYCNWFYIVPWDLIWMIMDMLHRSLCPSVWMALNNWVCCSPPSFSWSLKSKLWLPRYRAVPCCPILTSTLPYAPFSLGSQLAPCMSCVSKVWCRWTLMLMVNPVYLE